LYLYSYAEERIQAWEVICISLRSWNELGRIPLFFPHLGRRLFSSIEWLRLPSSFPSESVSYSVKKDAPFCPESSVRVTSIFFFHFRRASPPPTTVQFFSVNEIPVIDDTAFSDIRDRSSLLFSQIRGRSSERVIGLVVWLAQVNLLAKVDFPS